MRTQPAISPGAGDGLAGSIASALESRTLVLACLLMSAAPLLFVQLPPLVDIFGHIGRYTVQTELAARPELQAFYSFEWRLIGNLGGDLMVEALHPLFGVEGAVRVIVMANQLLAALGLLLISREVHGRITPYAIFALPLIYGFPFTYGFLNYTLSMALALVAFAVWLRLRRRGRVSASVFLLLAGAASWICHTYGWGFLGLLCGSAALASAIEDGERGLALIRRVVSECAPLFLPLVPMLLWRSGAEGAVTGEWSLALKVLWLVSIFRTQWMIADIASALLLFCLVYAALRSPHRSVAMITGLAALFATLAFVALPARIFGSYLADMRIAPYALALALLAISPARLQARQLAILTCAALAFLLLRTGLTTAAYVEKDSEVAAALAALPSLPEGARVATFVIETCETPWSPPVLSHAGSIALARRNVVTNDQWALPGMNLLSVHNEAAGPFASDPSQMVNPDDCGNATHPRLTPVLDYLPRGAFTHVWVMGELPETAPALPGLELVRADNASLLYEVAP